MLRYHDLPSEAFAVIYRKKIEAKVNEKTPIQYRESSFLSKLNHIKNLTTSERISGKSFWDAANEQIHDEVQFKKDFFISDYLNINHGLNRVLGKDPKLDTEFETEKVLSKDDQETLEDYNKILRDFGREYLKKKEADEQTNSTFLDKAREFANETRGTPLSELLRVDKTIWDLFALVGMVVVLYLLVTKWYDWCKRNIGDYIVAQTYIYQADQYNIDTWKYDSFMLVAATYGDAEAQNWKEANRKKLKKQGDFFRNTDKYKAAYFWKKAALFGDSDCIIWCDKNNIDYQTEGSINAP